MKVPYAPQVGISHQGAEYQRAADTSGIVGALSQGLGQLARGVGAAVADQENEQNKEARFKALIDFSHFEQGVGDSIDEVKRGWVPGQTDFDAKVNSAFDKRKQDFLKGIDPNLRSEFDYRTEQVRLGIHSGPGGTEDFKTKQSDAFQRAGLGEIVTKAQVGVAADASTAQTWIGRVNEAIDATTLSEAEKSALKLKTESQVRGIEYKQEIKKGESAPSTYKAKVRQIESSGDDAAVSPTGAKGRYQFTSGTWSHLASKYPELGLTPDGRSDPTQQERAMDALTADNREALANGLHREPTQGELYLAHQQGAGGALALLRNPNARAVDVTNRQFILVNGGNENMTAGEFVAKWTSKFGETQGTSSIDSDPRFALVPYEDRLTYRADAQRELAGELADQITATKAAHNSAINDLYNDISAHPETGQQRIDEGVQSGLLADYDERKKAVDILAAKDGERKTLNDGLSNLHNHLPVTADQLNAITENDDAGTKIQRRDEGYINNNIAPMAHDANAWPSNVKFMLEDMARDTVAQNKLFALNSLDKIQSDLPKEVAAQLGAGTLEALDAWRAGVAPEDINKPQTPEQRQTNESLTEDAKKRVEDTADSVDLSAEWFAGHFKEPGILPFGFSDTSPSFSMYPETARALELSLQNKFIQLYPTYSRMADPDEATKKAVLKSMEREYNYTTVNGQLLLMKDPPEWSGYSPGPTAVPGGEDMSWIGREVTAHFGLGEGETWEPISDEQTAQERANLGKPGSPKPSYAIVTFDKDGVARLRPGRFRFEKSTLDHEKEAIDYEYKRIVDGRNRFMVEVYSPARNMERISDAMKVPQEIEDQKKDWDTKVEDVTRERAKVFYAPTSGGPIPLGDMAPELGVPTVY